MNYAVSEDYMLKMVGVTTASNYVTAYIDTNITANNNALYNPALSPSLNGIAMHFTNPRMFSKYKGTIMYLTGTNSLIITNYYSNAVSTNTTTISGTIVTPISGGFGNN